MQTDLPAPRAWIRLPSGAALDLISPSPHAWTDEDLAKRLARTYRWGGESTWTWPLSVAQHSLLVLALRRQASAEPLTPQAALMELLHDAEEGFLGFDCISPLKRVLGQPFLDVANRLLKAVNVRYGLPGWPPSIYPLHKRADSIAAASEAVHCVGWSMDEVRDVLQIGFPVLRDDPLHARYGGAPWEPWPSDQAGQRFLEELNSLLKQRDSSAARSASQP